MRCDLLSISSKFMAVSLISVRDLVGMITKRSYTLIEFLNSIELDSWTGVEGY